MKKAFIIPFLVATSALAQPDAPPVNTDAILKELQQIKDTGEASIKNQFARVLQTVNSASSNGSAAMDLYLQANRSVQFSGQSNESVQFQEWKKKEGDKLKSKGFQEALRLYLVYLSLTLQSSMGAKTSDLIAPLVNYATQVNADADFIEDGRDLMNKSLGESVIVRGFGVALKPASNWVMTPGDIDEMYLRIILPALREKQDPSAVEYWNQKIERESEATISSKRNFDQDRFTKNRKPALLWNRAKEFYLIGQKNRGITEMFAVIKACPSHPDCARWIAEFEGLLAKKGS